MNTSIRLTLAAALLALLSACGNKGPLVLPDSPEAESAQTAPQDAPAATGDPATTAPATTEPTTTEPTTTEPATTAEPTQAPVQEDAPAPVAEPATPTDGGDGDP